jgi:hypothetical protein
VRTVSCTLSGIPSPLLGFATTLMVGVCWLVAVVPFVPPRSRGGQGER